MGVALSRLLYVGASEKCLAGCHITFIVFVNKFLFSCSFATVPTFILLFCSSKNWVAPALLETNFD